MSSRRYDFLARCVEAVDVLLRAIEELELVLLTDPGGIKPMEIADPTELRQLDPMKPASFQLAKSFSPRSALLENLDDSEFKSSGRGPGTLFELWQRSHRWPD